MTDTPATPATDSNSPANASERIAKVIARSGVASRRDAEKMILAGRVTVNGKTIDSPALDVLPSDKVTIDGKPIDAPQETRVWLYYKPLGLVTTEKDDQGRRTIFDEMPEGMPRVLNVGRLDLNSEGLLLLTNDGGLKRRLELPETGWLRKYRVRVNGRPTNETFDPLRRGITIEGEDFQPMEVSLDRQQGANAWLTVGIREGKNREIRRAMTEVGMTVNRLIRLSYGPFRLNDMQPGDVVEVKRKMLRDQLGDRLLMGVEDGRPSRAERMAPKGPRGRRDEGDGSDRPRRAPRPEGAPERTGGERRGFGRQRDFAEGADATERKPYRPRDEGDRKPRAFGSKSHRDEDAGGKRPYVRRDGDEGGKRPYAPRRDDGEAPRKPRAFEAGEGKRPFTRRDGDEGGKRPYGRRDDAEGSKRPYTPRPRREEGDAPRKPRAFDAGEGKRPFTRRDGDEGGKRPYGRRDDAEGGKRPYTQRPPREGGDERKPRSFDKPRREGGFEGKPRREGGFEGKPRSFDKPRRDGDFEGKPRREGGFEGKPRRLGDKSEGGKPGFKSTGFKSHGGKPGAKPRAEGSKSHTGKATGSFKRPPRPEGKPRRHDD